MKLLKTLLTLVGLFIFQWSYSQGCEDPGEGDGIKFFGFIQPQYEYEINGVNSDYNTHLEDNNSGFFFNRARLGVMGNVPYDFSYYFMIEYAPAAGFGVCDAFVSYNRFKPYLTASVGQFKTPFGAEQLQGCHKLYTIDRSKVSTNLGAPIRDMGIMLSGGTGEKIKIKEGVTNVIAYQVAWMNGNGRDLIANEELLASLPDKYESWSGRVTFNPSQKFNLGFSGKYARDYPSTEETDFDTRTRLGVDATVKYNKFIVTGEYLWGKDDGSKEIVTGEGCSATTEIVPGSDKKDGYYVTALYKTNWNFEPVVKYEAFDISKETENDQVMRWTLGFNYFFNEWTRLQMNYQYNFQEAEYAWNDTFQDMLQIQLQIVIK
jgi:hypothetical protein